MAKSRNPKKGKHHKCFLFFGLRLLAIVMFAFLWFTAFGHCDVSLSLDYGSWPL
jgi:hypothetical protein